MQNYTFTAFGLSADIQVDPNDLGGVYELSAAMAKANEWLHTIPAFIRDPNGSWLGEGNELRWVSDNFHD